MRRPKLRGARAELAERLDEFAILRESRDTSDCRRRRIGCLARMALGDEDVAVWCDDNAGRLGQGLRRVAWHTRRADRQQHFAVWAELSHCVTLRFVFRVLFALAVVRASFIDHPDVAFPI